MNQTTADVPDEAEKPKNNENNYYGPEHGYVFPLSLFEHRIWTDSRGAIKQKVKVQGEDGSRLR
jgi:hypothetical protein